MVRVLVLRLGHEAEGREEREHADRNVDEEDPRPGERLRQPAAEHEAEGRAADGDRGPDAERLRALLPLGERRRDDRERGGGDESGPEALQRAEADQLARARREPVQERRRREDDEADEEEPLAAEKVAGATAEQEEAAEHERVRIDDPLEVGLAQAEVLLDGREGDVHDRRVEDDHELCEADQDEDHPGIRAVTLAHAAPCVKRTARSVLL